MATILETFNARISEEGVQGNIVDAKRKGMDLTPYSIGNGYAGERNIDEDGVKAVEQKNAKGNRYQVGEFGGGSEYLKNGYTNEKPYGKKDRNL